MPSADNLTVRHGLLRGAELARYVKAMLCAAWLASATGYVDRACSRTSKPDLPFSRMKLMGKLTLQSARAPHQLRHWRFLMVASLTWNVVTARGKLGILRARALDGPGGAF